MQNDATQEGQLTSLTELLQQKWYEKSLKEERISTVVNGLIGMLVENFVSLPPLDYTNQTHDTPAGPIFITAREVPGLPGHLEICPVDSSGIKFRSLCIIECLLGGDGIATYKLTYPGLAGLAESGYPKRLSLERLVEELSVTIASKFRPCNISEE